MLVVISDLHFTDGSCGASLAAGACDLLVERLEDLAVRASWRASGNYQPLDRIDVLLLGDTLDLLQSTRWLQSRVRPWSNLHTAEGAALLRTLLGDVLRHNETALTLLRACGSEEGIAVPPADRQGRPAARAVPQKVPVNLHYAVGEHDWLLHMPGPAFDAMRQMVNRALGMSGAAESPFPHDPAEDERLGEVLLRHRAVARHGDQFDAVGFSGRRDQASLTDALLIELLVPFVDQTRRELSGELPPALSSGLAELSQVRPLLLMPVWLDALLDRTCPAAALRHKIQRQWDRAADRLLALDALRAGSLTERQGLMTDLANLLKFNRRPTGSWAAATGQWCQANGVPMGSLAAQALAERDFRNRRAKHVVYGHTHVAETAALEISSAGAFSLPQMYFNTGTWQRVYQPTRLAPGPQDFIASESFNLVMIYHGDERGGRGFETWSGSLGVASAQAMRRLDAGRLDAAAGGTPAQSPQTAATVPGHGPHFTAPAVWTTNVSSSTT
jgi:hypothetical protein